MSLTKSTPGMTAGSGAQSAKNSRNPGIDLLRGLSILFVILNHLGLRIPLKKTALADVLPGWFLSRSEDNGHSRCSAGRAC